MDSLFTEFSYQLIQGYDFYYLWKHHNCLVQMGGSDQWGTLTGSELVRRQEQGSVYKLDDDPTDQEIRWPKIWKNGVWCGLVGVKNVPF